MEITERWLQDHNACADGSQWFYAQKETDAKKVIRSLIKTGHLDWANWTLVRLLTHTQNIQYACYSAKQCLHAFEKAFPQDKRPRRAIMAAAKYAKNPTEENRSAARSAAWSAESAARSAAWSAARSAARSAESAARSAAWSAARSAESAAWSAESAVMKKCIRYGLRFL